MLYGGENIRVQEGSDEEKGGRDLKRQGRPRQHQFSPCDRKPNLATSFTAFQGGRDMPRVSTRTALPFGQSRLQNL